MGSEALHQLLAQSTRLYPDHIAAEEPGRGALTYTELAVLSDRVRDRLSACGVRQGDRVGIYMRKSIDAVASIFGILKTGAAYTPVDPGAPASRNAYILNNCSVKVVLVEERFAGKLHEELARLGELPRFLILEGTGGGEQLRRTLDREDAQQLAPKVGAVHSAPGDLAYILYTSGSTGQPKGVML